MSRFAIDNVGQKAVRDAVIGPKLYGVFSLNGRYVYIDKGRLSDILQKRFAVDTVAQSKRTKGAVFIEEKIVRWPGYQYDAMTLETKSCTVQGRESEGWMTYGEADQLNYAMCQENGDVLCHLIDFQKLKRAFWCEIKSFERTVTKQINQTECRIVRISWIKERVGIWERRLRPDDEGRQIVKAYNAGHYLKNR